MVINGFLPDIEKQWMELTYFKENFAAEVELKSTIIICSTGREKDTLEKMAPTPEVIFLECAFYQPEVVLAMLVKEMVKEDLYLFGYTYSACECAVRAATRIGGSVLTGVHEMTVGKGGIQASKMVYSNYMGGEFLLKKAPFCIAIANGIGEQKFRSYGSPKVRIVNATAHNPSHLKSHVLQQETKKEMLKDAERLVVAGRGIGKKDDVEIFQNLAQSINGSLGVSRPVAMNAWAPMEKLIGVSGTMAKPKICIAAGVSGAGAFYSGIEKSEFIVAINNDQNAPIIKKSDVAIIDDCIAVAQALELCIKEERQAQGGEGQDDI